jgi:hypothetical protein
MPGVFTRILHTIWRKKLKHIRMACGQKFQIQTDFIFETCFGTRKHQSKLRVKKFSRVKFNTGYRGEGKIFWGYRHSFSSNRVSCWNLGGRQKLQLGPGVPARERLPLSLFLLTCREKNLGP